MLKWGISNASVLVNEPGYPLFLFQKFSYDKYCGESLNENLLSLLFQRNYFKSDKRLMKFQPAHLPFGPRIGTFYRGQLVICPRVYNSSYPTRPHGIIPK